jgi:hypothetical protein
VSRAGIRGLPEGSVVLQHTKPSKQTEAPDREVLAGLVERVTFHNADNGFCVLRAKARGHRELITVVGHAATINAGQRPTSRPAIQGPLPPLFRTDFGRGTMSGSMCLTRRSGGSAVALLMR